MTNSNIRTILDGYSYFVMYSNIPVGMSCRYGEYVLCDDIDVLKLYSSGDNIFHPICEMLIIASQIDNIRVYPVTEKADELTIKLSDGHEIKLLAYKS